MKWLSIVALFLIAAPALADSLDDAEAKRRGVAVEVVQLERAKAQIADLQKQVADLSAQIVALKNGTTATRPGSTTNPMLGIKKSRKDLPQEVQDYLTFRDSEYKSEIATLKMTITDNSRPIPANVEYDSPADRATDQQKARNEVATATKRLQQLTKDGPGTYIPGFYIHYSKVGIGGHIADTVKVVQVLSRTSAIIEQGGTQVIIDGSDFSKISDDATITVPECVLIKGTTTFDTVLNARRTLLQLTVFEPLDYKDY